MRYDFDKMDADSFELMVRSLNERIFGIKCDQYGLGPDGQREFTFDGDITDPSGTVFRGKTFGQVKYKYPVTKEDDYTWLKTEIAGELERFRQKEKEYIPENYLFYTNIVLTPMKDQGVKDKIEKFIKKENDIIPHFYIRGYDEVCALLDNNRDVAACYASHILPGDVLMEILHTETVDYSLVIQKYLARELEEDMYTRLDHAGSVTEKKISIEKVCVDIDVIDREENETVKFAEKILKLGNKVLGYRKRIMKKETKEPNELERSENFVLMGGPGRGKTTMCQFISQIYRANYLQETKYNDLYSASFMQDIRENYSYEINCRRIPFKISLREYAAWISRQGHDDDISVLQYMRGRIKKIEGEELSVYVMRQMLERLAWIFIFDGLDEVPESSNRGEVLRQIELFISAELRETCCDCIIIGTTRMQGYNDDFDERRYKHMEVSELSRTDCEKYITKLFEVMEEQTDKREEYISIMKEALEDETTNRLMQTPLQATIISILVKSGGKPPHERYSLFRQYYDTMIRREKQKGIIATLNDNTDWIEEIHLYIADRLQRESENAANPSAEIGRGELEEVIQQYIDENKDSYYETDGDLEKKVKEFLLVITQRICFLCENREGFFSFSIRTMQEYFAGTYMVKGVRDEEAMENIRRVAYNSYWRNALLFALGYIELEKKALEAEIGILCGEMNGRDNLLISDYTEDNICLFGSWLAVDILAEDIFKGKRQNKYIEYAARAIERSGCMAFGKFSQVTGVQCDKLRRYVKEHYQEEGRCLEGVFALYMKLSENEKNNLEPDMVELLQACSEEEKLRFCITIIERGAGFFRKGMYIWTDMLRNFIIEGKVKQFLPTLVINRILRAYEADADVRLKRFLFLQVIYGYNIRNHVLEKQFGISEGDVLQINAWLRKNHFGVDNPVLDVTDNFEYNFLDFTPDRTCLENFRKTVKELQIDFLVKLCDFALEPAFSTYQELLRILEKEEDYLAEVYRRSLGPCALRSELEFNEYYENRREIERLFLTADTETLMRKDSCPGLGYSVSCEQDAFKELMEKGPYPIERIGELGKTFLESYLFVLRNQAGNFSLSEELDTALAAAIIRLLEEAADRKVYTYQLSRVIAAMSASCYRREMFTRIPAPYFNNYMFNREIEGKTMGRFRKGLSGFVMEAALSNIVKWTVSNLQENTYLQLLTLFLREAPRIAEYISPYELGELESIVYTDDKNKLGVLLLKMCIGEENNREELMDNILALDMERKTIYTAVIRTLCGISTKDGEEMLCLNYILLEKEKFQERSALQNRIINEFYERKSNETGERLLAGQ